MTLFLIINNFAYKNCLPNAKLLIFIQ